MRFTLRFKASRTDVLADEKGTYNQFKVYFKRLGINVKFAPSLDPKDYEKLIDSKTKAVYIESIGAFLSDPAETTETHVEAGNPAFSVPDIPAFAQLAHSHGLPLIVDNTCAPIDSARSRGH